METLLGIIRPLFWGLLMLSALVFVHEGGHFLASRAVGVRVTEFFLGLPCRFNLHHVSRRIGTKFGVTPLLLGGYAMVCGMEPEGDSAIAKRVLSEVHRRGTATVAELSEALSISEEDALAACVQLLAWGSIEGRYDEAAGEKPGVYYPSTYAAAPRDKAGATLLDGAQFKRNEATGSGEAWEPPMGEDAFFERELFFDHLRFSERDEAIHFLGDQVVGRYGAAVGEDFVNSVIAREEAFSTAFGNMVAIPHPSEALSSVTVACVGLLDEPVEWDSRGNRVRVVILMAFSKDDTDGLKDLMSLLAELLTDPDLVSGLLASQGWEYFARLLEDSNNKGKD